MKKLLPGTLAILILICSCSTKKSFTHQRYTNFKHKKATPVADNRSYARKAAKITVAEPETVVINPVSGPVAPAKAVEATPVNHDKIGYTKSVINRVILPVASKGKETFTNLLTSSSKQTITKPVKIKPLNLDQKQEKRGLLWGVIDGILAIIVLAVFVALVVWLVLVLAP